MNITLTSPIDHSPAESKGWRALLGRTIFAMIRWTGVFLARYLYRIERHHLPEVPSGGLLLIGNHVSYADVVLLQATFPRPIRFIGAEKLTRKPFLAWLFSLSGAIPVTPQKPRRALELGAQCLRAGEVVCIFPEGGLTRDGQTGKFRAGYEVLARSAGVPILPFHIRGAWGSCLSHHRDRRHFFQRLLPHHRRIAVRYGRLEQDAIPNPDSARELVEKLGVDSWQQDPTLNQSLGESLWSALRRQPTKMILRERQPNRGSWRKGSLLAVAWTIRENLLAQTPDRRIGIALPPGMAGTVANLAVLINGQIPVNLNVTAGERGFAAAIEDAGITQVLTAGPIMNKFSHLPWKQVKTHDLARILPRIKAGTFLRNWFKAVLCPRFLVRPAGLQKPRSSDQEAVLLFTSGSSGRPKGVPLSDQNVLGNIAQLESTGLLQPEDRILACLPLFHSFGLTVTLFYPLLKNQPIITLPSPLEHKEIALAIKEEKATVLAGTSTFLRPYPRMDQSYFGSLRLVVAGAERVPQSQKTAFAEQLKVPLVEGYGLTETSPVAAVNLPNRPSQNPGSVGHLLPGLTGRLIHPVSGEPVSQGASGILELKGINVFSGYLGQSREESLTEDGWYRTGDIARLDSEGFLYLEGRWSRFSKLGGEMVSHSAIEEALNARLGGEDSLFAVTSVSAPEQGEHLVLLHTSDRDPTEIRESLRKEGFPALWIPKKMKKVEAVPFLGSGKLDLAKLRQLAEAA